MGERSRIRVAVVGAGLAGLAAAHELQRAGIEVGVFERGDRPGGRAHAVAVDGLPLEPVSPVVSTADRALAAFAAVSRAKDALLPLRPVRTRVVYRGRAVDADPRTLLDFVRLPGVSPRQALRLVRLPRLMRRYGERLAAGEPEAGATLDDRSLADFGRLYFGSSVVDYWLGPFVTSASLGDPEQTSRVHLLRRHNEHFAARRGVMRATLAELAASAARDLSVLYGSEVRPASGAGLELDFVRDGREGSTAVDGVVVAIPADRAGEIAALALTTGERETLAGVRYTPAVALCARTVRPLTERPHELRVPRGESGVVETVLLEPGVEGGRVPRGYGAAAVHATGSWSAEAFDASDDVVEKELLAELERVHPGAQAAVDATRVVRLASARPRFDVGHYRALSRLARIEGERLAEGSRLALAGDYRAEPTWDGAVASGQRAARTLLSALPDPAREAAGH